MNRSHPHGALAPATPPSAIPAHTCVVLRRGGMASARPHLCGAQARRCGLARALPQRRSWARPRLLMPGGPAARRCGSVPMAWPGLSSTQRRGWARPRLLLPGGPVARRCGGVPAAWRRPGGVRRHGSLDWARRSVAAAVSRGACSGRGVSGRGRVVRERGLSGTGRVECAVGVGWGGMSDED